MIDVDQMVMFSHMTRRRINLVRLIIDFIIAAVSAEKRRHFTLPYGMFLISIFIRAQLSLDTRRADNKKPTTSMTNYFTLGLKPQGQGKEKE